MKIKIYSPSDNKLFEIYWGDYWAKYYLSKAFEQLGHNIVDENSDLDFILCNGFPYVKSKAKLKAVWVYTRFETSLKNLKSYKNYDHVFSLSPTHVFEFTNRGLNASFLPVGSDRTPLEPNYQYDLTFIGNTNKAGRVELIETLSELGINIALYGNGWDKTKMEKHHKGACYPNLELNKLYSSSRINLVSHEPQMSKYGLVGIKVLDIIKSGGFCLCDDNPGLSHYIKTFDTYDINTVKDKASYYLNNPNIREEMRVKALSECKNTWLDVAKMILSKF